MAATGSGLLGRWNRIMLCNPSFRDPMKTNVTVKLDANLLRELRIMAASEGMSISAFLSAQLEKMARDRKAYDGARRRALARMKRGFDLRWSPARSRNELHER